jgi:hypothetical protein
LGTNIEFWDKSLEAGEEEAAEINETLKALFFLTCYLRQQAIICQKMFMIPSEILGELICSP